MYGSSNFSIMLPSSGMCSVYNSFDNSALWFCSYHYSWLEAKVSTEPFHRQSCWKGYSSSLQVWWPLTWVFFAHCSWLVFYSLQNLSCWIGLYMNILENICVLLFIQQHSFIAKKRKKYIVILWDRYFQGISEMLWIHRWINRKSGSFNVCLWKIIKNDI